MRIEKLIIKIREEELYNMKLLPINKHIASVARFIDSKVGHEVKLLERSYDSTSNMYSFVVTDF